MEFFTKVFGYKFNLFNKFEIGRELEFVKKKI